MCPNAPRRALAGAPGRRKQRRARKRQEGGSIATASGLVFIGAADEQPLPCFRRQNRNGIVVQQTQRFGGVGAVHLSGQRRQAVCCRIGYRRGRRRRAGNFGRDHGVPIAQGKEMTLSERVGHLRNGSSPFPSCSASPTCKRFDSIGDKKIDREFFKSEEFQIMLFLLLERLHTTHDRERSAAA
jgi:hypothetical protein